MYFSIRSGCAFGAIVNTRIGFFHHLSAEIDIAHVVIEDRVIEHVVGAFTKVEDVVTEMRWLHAIGHVLIEHRCGHVIIAADPADAAADKVGVARIDAAHENIEAAKDHGGAVAFLHFAVRKIDFAMYAQAPDNAGDRIPRHFFDDNVGIVSGDTGSC